MSSPKISTSDAARRLRDHPANLVRELCEMVGSLDDCWPELEHGFVETLEKLRGGAKEAKSLESRKAVTHEQREQKPRRSPASMKILDKLARKDKWGGNAVGWDTLRNHYCRGERDLDDAVDQLVEDGLLLAGENHDGPYSLNPARKGEIEELVGEFRSARR